MRIDPSQRCNGCGVCAAACRQSVITIALNSYGEYQPQLAGDGCSECGRCLDVCPLRNRPQPENSVDLFAGFDRFGVGHAADKQIRQRAASGGVTTALLVSLFAENVIDGVLCAGFVPDSTLCFKAVICRQPAEIVSCQGSKYYPIEFSRVLKEIADDGRSYAVVCLPCVASALNRLRRTDRRFRGLRYLVTLTCGHNKSSVYLNFLLQHYGLTLPLSEVSFRGKSSEPFSNYLLRAVDVNGNSISEHFRNGFISHLWCGYYFAQKGCLGCRDLFGISGDISCMDAWLSPYDDSKSGYNFFMTKNDFATRFIDRNPRLCCATIDRKLIIASQQAIFTRKTSGIIPVSLVENRDFSDRLPEGTITAVDLLSQLTAKAPPLSTPWRPGVRTRIIEFIKRRSGYYENLVGRERPPL